MRSRHGSSRFFSNTIGRCGDSSSNGSWGSTSHHLRAAVANHPDARAYVEHHGVAFHDVPVPTDAEGKAAAFAQVERLLETEAADLVVLARYMQVLPPALCRRYAGRILNIHHSFLPSFAGGQPYRQAFERGVKLVGINSVSTPMPRRLKVWERLVQDLDLSKLHALTTHVTLDEVPKVAADIVAGQVKGRVVVDIRQG